MGRDKEGAGCDVGWASFWCLLAVSHRQVGLQHSLSQGIGVFPLVLLLGFPLWSKVCYQHAITGEENTRRGMNIKPFLVRLHLPSCILDCQVMCTLGKSAQVVCIDSVWLGHAIVTGYSHTDINWKTWSTTKQEKIGVYPVEECLLQL